MTDARDFLIRGSEKVISHYQLLLASARDESERELYRSRIEREEHLIARLRAGTPERIAA